MDQILRRVEEKYTEEVNMGTSWPSFQEKRKFHESGYKYKARLDARGFSHVYGANLTENNAQLSDRNP